MQTYRFAKQARRIARVLRKPPSHIEELRNQRLRRLLRHAVTAPFFREKYKGLDVSQIELSQLPTTSKQELMTNFDQALTDPAIRRADVESFMSERSNIGQLYRGRYCLSHTSGSQGQPLLLVQDHHCLEILFATSARADPRGNPDLLEGVRRLIRPLRMAVVSMIGFSASGHAFTFMPSVVGRFVRMTRLSPMQPDLIERLNDLQPNAILAYPSVLDGMASQSKRIRFGPPRLRQVSAFGEQLTAPVRERIKQRLGVPVFDHYGIGECLFLADGCPTDGGAHINTDWAILEVVDKDRRPVPLGQAGAKILVTNLANTIQPIIRYEVDDVVTLAAGPCGCGSPLPRIAKVEGRSGDVLWVGEQMLTYILFKTAIEYLHQVREWQAVQLAPNRIEIRLELLPQAVLDQGTAERIVIQKLRELGMPAQVEATLRFAPSLGSDPVTGKFNRMVSQFASH
jgi:phenylacetate-coenzyme A ligase PaaK-like adenylate-forming protein